MFAVQPQPEGSNASTVTLIASPGSAPSTKTGPVTGLTLPKSSAARSASVDFGPSCPPEESRVSNSTVPPGATVSTGGFALSQPKWLFVLWIVWLQVVVIDAAPLLRLERGDRKSTRLNSSHVKIAYAVFCLKKKTE